MSLSQLSPPIAQPGSLFIQVADLVIDAGIESHEAIRLLRTALLREALERSRGNVCRAAKLLGQHRNTLNRMLDEFGMQRLPRQIRQAHSSQARLPLRKPSTAAVTNNTLARGAAIG